MLPKDVKSIIHKMKTSMYVADVNKQIKNLQRQCGKADDIWINNHNINNGAFWNREHNVYYITTNEDFKIKSIFLDYESMRDMGGRQWTYICNDCGEYLVNTKEKCYECECHEYICSF